MQVTNLVAADKLNPREKLEPSVICVVRNNSYAQEFYTNAQIPELKNQTGPSHLYKDGAAAFNGCIQRIRENNSIGLADVRWIRLHLVDGKANLDALPLGDELKDPETNQITYLNLGNKLLAYSAISDLKKEAAKTEDLKVRFQMQTNSLANWQRQTSDRFKEVKAIKWVLEHVTFSY